MDGFNDMFFLKAKYRQEYINDTQSKRITDFMEYFTDFHLIIEKKILNKDRSFLKRFAQEFKHIFPLYEKHLCYNFYEKEGRFTFVFYYGRDSYLLTIFTALIEAKVGYRLDNWQFISKK